MFRSTKLELAVEQLKRLMAAGIGAMWAAADEVYGRSGEFRAACRALSLAYVVIIPATTRSPSRKTRLSTLTRPYQARCSSGGHAGTDEGPPLQRLGAGRRRGPARVPAIRLPAREKNQYTFYLCWAPEDRPATMTYFITIAGRRWPAEETFKTGKDTLGWDTSQARTYDAICRDIALTALAQLRTAAIRAALAGAMILPAADGRPDTARAVTGNTVSADDLHSTPGGAPVPARGGQPCPPGIPRSSCPAPRLARIQGASHATGKPGLISRARLAFRLRWSRWRRRHQARARWHHYSTRLQALTT